MTEANPYAAPTSDLVVEDVDYGDSAVLSFKSRAGRLRYIARISLFALVGYFVVGLVVAVAIGLGEEPEPDSAGFVVAYWLFFAASMIFGLMFAVQRVHDLNRSGWMSLLVLVPLVNLVMMLYLLLARGTEGVNDYGPPPPPNTLGVKLAALLFPLMFVAGIIAGIAVPAYQEYATRAQEMQMQMENER